MARRADPNPSHGREEMRIWNWILSLFRRGAAQEEPLRNPHFSERHRRDAAADFAARATEAGITKGSPPFA